MLGIMIEKMWHKRWMNLSLLLGCILLVATAVSFPLYEQAAYNRMLHDEFNNYVSTNGKWPATLKMKVVSRREEGGQTISNMEEFAPFLYEDLRVREKETSYLYFFSQNGIHSDFARFDVDSETMRLAAKTDLNDHIKIISGEAFSAGGVTADGALEAVISQNCMVEKGLLVGETLQFDVFKDYYENPVRVKIVGVFAPAEDNDYYWQDDLAMTNDMLLVNMDTFKSMFTGEKAGKFTITGIYNVLFEYSDIDAADVKRLYEDIDYYINKSDYSGVFSNTPFIDIYDIYENKHSRISATLTILQIPVLIMLAAFLLMISSQMYQMEKNEISVIKSRGSSRAQIFRLYLYQAIVLTGVGAVLGIPLGMLMSKMLGAARTFLKFDFSERLEVSFSTYSLMYAIGSVLLALLCLTLPAIKHSKVTIVNLKQQNAIAKKPLWEKLFLDLILIAVAGYGYYNFNRNSSDLAESVLNNRSLDPLLYLSSSLMIIGLGLLFLRLKTLLLKGIFRIGRDRWKPASFVSFTENVKNGTKQQLIMLFLVMTVSLGMYHSAVAGTIVENAVKNTEYIDGTDMIIREVWPETIDENGAPTGKYKEPDSSKYISAPFIKNYTKVLNNTTAKATVNQRGPVAATVMGIQTKEFGGITYVDKNLNGDHYYNYLNKLAKIPAGAIVSSNFRDKMGYKVGDNISVNNGTAKSGNASVQIVDFVDYWPGFAMESNVLRPDGTVDTVNNYLVVGNFSYLMDKMGQYPYEIWIETREGSTETDVYNWIEENDVHIKRYMNRNKDLDSTKSDPLLQGTNGVLTLGFVVTILLCAVGYLIYWIMSLKSRELVFGVLRASGFHKNELFHMLFNEQIFCGILSVAAGFGIGSLTSTLFVPILQKAYATDGQVLPLVLYTNVGDLVRLISVIVGVMVLCLVVLTVMLLKMNVAKALKLGED